MRNLLHPNTLNYYRLPEHATVHWVETRSLLCSERLDVLARWAFARSLLNGHGIAFGEELYRTLLVRQSDDFRRGADPGKSDILSYLASFRELLQDMATRGFDPARSVLPVCGRTIVDGAHRLAAAVALGLERVPCVDVEGEPIVMDAATLLQIGMPQWQVDWLTLMYCRFQTDVRAAVFFPCAHRRVDEGIKRLAARVEVARRISVSLTRAGMRRLMRLLYGAHTWWDDYHERQFAQRRWSPRTPVTVVFFIASSAPVRQLKEEIRAALGIGNDGLHTTDTHEETLELARTVLNENGLHRLNWARSLHVPNFDRLFERFRARLAEPGVDRDLYCIDSSSTMAVYGLRDVSDIDYLSLTGRADLDEQGEINLHNEEYEGFPNKIDEIIEDPRNHFYFRGVKFISLEMLARMKRHRGQAKDLADLRLIRSIEYRLVPPSLRSLWPRFQWSVRRWMEAIRPRLFVGAVSVLRLTMPNTPYRALRSFYRNLRK